MNITAQLARDPQAHLPTGPTHVVARATRTPAEVESNRAFLAAAGRMEFGRYENTLRAVFMAFAYFASFGPERVCYATVEHVAERAKVSARTVQRHIPALVSRELITAPTRAGGHVPTVWKLLVSEPAPIERGVTACHPRGDIVSPNISNRGSSSGPRPNGASAPQKRDGKNCGSGPVTNHPLAMKAASDAPSQAEQKQPDAPSSLSLVQPRPNEGRLKRWWADEKAQHGPKTTKQQTAILEPETTPTPETTPERRAAALALFAAVDAGIDTAAEVAMLQKRHDAISQRRGVSDRGGCCPQCASDRLIGGSCNVCGYDDGSEPRPSADWNAGGDT